MRRWLLAAGWLLLALPGLADDDGARFTTFLGLHLNIGTLDGVQARLGRTRLIEEGEGEDYQARVCYLGSAGVVSFLSSVRRLELSGLEVRQADGTGEADCRELRRADAETAAQLAGLHLGMNKAEFAVLLGEPLQWNGDGAERVFESERPMDADERRLFKDSPELMARGTFHVAVTVGGSFFEGRLVEFRVWKLVYT